MIFNCRKCEFSITFKFKELFDLNKIKLNRHLEMDPIYNERRAIVKGLDNEVDIYFKFWDEFILNINFEWDLLSFHKEDYYI